VLVGENHGLYPVAEVELSEHPGDVGLYRGLRDEQRGRYLAVLVTLLLAEATEISC
jgi:hypothetical protein